MAHEKDAATNNYLSDPVRFADLYNGSLFKGKKVIHPEDLEELHNSMNVLVPDNKNHIKSERRYRDIVKKSFSGTQFLVLACENQYEVHYAMVVRNMLYDSLNYTQQVENLRRSHRQSKDIKKSAEFLSGIKKTDRLAPVITLVLYFGTKPWDAGLQLYDLIDFSPEMEELKPYISNYKLNLIDVQSVEHPEYYHSDLREVFGIIKHKSSKEQLAEYLAQNTERYTNLKEETFTFINILLGEEDHLEHFKKLAFKEKEGGYDMCKAFDEMRKEGEEIGEIRFAALSMRLLNNCRLEDLAKAASDQLYRKKLYQEFQLLS